ncbi:dTDP-glucose 4,6-dehydratase [Rubricoccus marinus]|uniref:dTDP-glucose 4,6-dehydratase n=1 Tax=Rubricoccus marinus TaxID=716817 RepID=A0A259TXM7_9BACT|nr:dTDP-glucose 4,6-dehydratase [Rubricoccus marinus]OZC02461.1 dTDP-glucose 4,6-dehydratase [Rubricoccus marinus]
MSFQPSALLITGGAGFIGANFLRVALAADPSVRLITLDALTYAGSRSNLVEDPRHTFVQGDIADGEIVRRLLAEHEIDGIVHFAAESHVDRSILGPAAFVQTNVVGTFQLLDAAREAWGDRQDVRFHHVSTDEVYGDLTPEAPAFRETTPYDPSSPYSATKAASDHLVRAYARTYGLPVTITNCSNNYGPFQYPEKLIPLTILRALSGRTIPIYGDGQQVRDWLYVRDHCEAIWQVLTRAASGATYNVGGGNQPTNLDLVHRICGILDERHPQGAPHVRLVEFVTDRPGHDRRYAMDTTAIARDLGWRPRHTLSTGLDATVAWIFDNREWLAAIARENDLDDWIATQYTDR